MVDEAERGNFSVFVLLMAEETFVRASTMLRASMHPDVLRKNE